MSNPSGANDLFVPQPQYGEVAQQLALQKEAPISGAPVPGTGTTSAPATSPGPSPVPAGPMATPYTPAPSGAAYYNQLANTWRALAAIPGSSPQVKALAKTARQREQNQHALAGQGVPV